MRYWIFDMCTLCLKTLGRDIAVLRFATDNTAAWGLQAVVLLLMKRDLPPRTREIVTRKTETSRETPPTGISPPRHFNFLWHRREYLSHFSFSSTTSKRRKLDLYINSPASIISSPHTEVIPTPTSYRCSGRPCRDSCLNQALILVPMSMLVSWVQVKFVLGILKTSVDG